MPSMAARESSSVSSAVTAVASGMTLTAAARLFGVEIATVSRAVKRRGLPSVPRGPRPDAARTPIDGPVPGALPRESEAVAAAVAAVEAGASIQAAAAAHNVSTTSIYRARVKRGLPSLPRGPSSVRDALSR